jgi:16S rRNA (cytidine1402-2'-O)-methyltransferase
MSLGKLYLIPLPLTGADHLTLSPAGITAAYSITHFAVERAKTARNFIKSIGHPVKLQEIEVLEIPDPLTLDFQKTILDWLEKGLDVGLMSEAGLPCIADPGNEIVFLAHQNSIQVIPCPGPNSMVLALMASGMNAQQFRFNGYLPAKKELLRHKLIELVVEIKKTGVTQLFMETPYRNKQVMDMMPNNIPAEFKLCIAASINAPDEIILTKKIKEWNENDFSKFPDKPAIFILGR